MLGIHAGRIIAVMANLEAIGNRAIFHLPRNAMSNCRDAIAFYLPIAHSPIAPTGPDPTARWVRFIDGIPEKSLMLLRAAPRLMPTPEAIWLSCNLAELWSR